MGAEAPPDLPVTTHGWRLSIVEAKKVIAVITFPPHLPAGTAEPRAYPKEMDSKLSTSDDLWFIVAQLHLGSFIDARPVPVAPDLQQTYVATFQVGVGTASPPLLIGNPLSWYFTPSGWDEYMPVFDKWVSTWAIELADRHIAETDPNCEQAQQRMTAAYQKLFELERALRMFVDEPLSRQYETKHWLLKAYKDSKYQEVITQRKSEEQYAWLDILDDSETRFLDFDHIRQLIHANPSVFSPLVPDVQQFKRLLEDLRDFRNRIGHVNTLSEDHYQDFLRISHRVLSIIRPKPVRPS